MRGVHMRDHPIGHPLEETRELSLPVIMVRRPPPEPGDAVETVEAAVDWLASEHLFQKTKGVS